jgi:hypothetical protein
MSEKPNLDLIGMVQRARMLHDAEAKPSQVAAVYWIEAKPAGVMPAPTPRAGYWEIDTELTAVDGLWQVVKEATESGALGYKAKVSTASRDGKLNSRVIRVCTRDAADSADVARVQQALLALGITPRRYATGDE